ncbi:substrate-binding periplasmic protein [Rhodoferax aquaticus]|uniref:Transporter substrate-binding domain-containing protein n=1 Tax=Rhodoferax aquaticus TaxID=2527691 RepID=A0A515EKQ3_9BURK|nr:transporter substrate-binding domain-containing protein [Rhodoferax aquaticus]QDL53247.1 transporter substrate-binding domain-containing protein [Rhodoferax aquaticus]
MAYSAAMVCGTPLKRLALLRTWWMGCGLVLAQGTWAVEPLRYGVMDSLSHPLVIQDGNGTVSGGLLLDLGQAVARELHTKLQVQPLARKRLDAAVQKGQVDLVCYWSPQWTTQADKVQWTMESLAQIERLVTHQGQMPSKVALDQLEGKRIATQLGYNYPSLQAWFDNGKLQRKDETRIVLMFKALDLMIAEALVASEAEIEGFFHTNPEARARFETSPYLFSKVATQCALSRKSPHTLEQVNKALSTLIESGELARMASAYKLSGL